jgi:hypothetical protein
MVLRQPLNQKIETPLAALRANPLTPLWPALDERPKPKQTDNIGVRGIFQQPNRRLITVKPANGQPDG